MAKKMKRKKSFPIRMFIIGFFILIQLVVLIGMIWYLSSATWIVYALFEAISILMVIFIVNRRENPSYKITWIIVILIFPLFGGLIYLLLGGHGGLPGKRKRMARIEKEGQLHLPYDPAIAARLVHEDLVHARQSRYLLETTHYPLFSNTRADFYPSGEEILPRLLAEMEKAKRYILVEFFILAEGFMWDQIHAVLRRKAAEGLDVRIIFDDFGSMERHYRGFAKGLKAEGVKLAVFNPLRPSVDMFMNNRSHRKIVSIDGEVAFTGGINIADEYINVIEKHGHWMDVGMFVTGDAAWSFTVMFLNMWQFITKKKVDYGVYRPLQRRMGDGTDGFVHPYCDGPFNLQNPGEGLYMQILNTAHKYVYITSPYLILDNEMITVLCLAAQSGVDVRIVTPYKEDKWYVHPVTRYNYEPLLKAGVRIYEYSPGFIHAKLFVSDDRVATVGTVNMDYRSFYFHFECGAWMCGTPAVLDVRNTIISLFDVCREIHLQEWKKRPVKDKLQQGILHLFAPFM